MKPYSIFIIEGYYPDDEIQSECRRIADYSYLNSGESWIILRFVSVVELFEIYGYLRKKLGYRVSLDDFTTNPEFVNFERIWLDKEIKDSFEFSNLENMDVNNLSIKVTVLKKDWESRKFWNDIDKMCEELSFKTFHNNSKILMKRNIYLK